MFSFKLIIGILFTLLISSIAVLGILSYQKNQASIKAAFWVQRTQKVLDKVEEVSSLYKDIQLESNAYFISGDSSILAPYTEAKQVIFEKVNAARRLTNRSINQQKRIEVLESLLKDLIVFTDSVLVIPRQSAYSQKNLLSRVKENRIFRAKIRKVINDLKDEEMKLLIIREKKNNDSIASFNRTFLLMLAGITLLLATTFFSIRYNFNKRIQTQQELKKANELFAKLFHESPIGMVISELQDGLVIDCNKAYEEIINYSRHEIIGKAPFELNLLNNESQRNDILQYARDNKTARNIEVRLKPKNKEPIWVSVSRQSINVNEKDCFLSAIMDMTAHKLAEERIEDALAKEIELNKMKSNFVALASHEFRTPLTTILSSAFLLEKYSFGQNQERVSKHVSRIKSAVNSLTSLLDEFLSLTKIEEGKVKPKFEMLNIKEQVHNVCMDLNGFTKPGQTINYIHNGDELVFSDPVLLGNIVNNLVSNAIKYSPENSRIEVWTTMNGKLYLAVKDSGIGIPLEDQKHLFERFYRASNAGTVQGTGLGLYIMHHYVKMLNGSIQLDSELGIGTEFKITFEASPPPGRIEDLK